jgi:hypothetical protein
MAGDAITAGKAHALIDGIALGRQANLRSSGLEEMIGSSLMLKMPPSA